MSHIRPITSSDAAGDRVDVGLSAGDRLVSVQYHHLPTTPDSGYASIPGRVDADISAVKLVLANQGIRTVTWAMVGPLEGIAVLEDGGAYTGAADVQIDVSRSNGWDAYVGTQIVSVAGAWHVSDEGCPEAMWALRLMFSGGAVVIALGTMDEEIRYMPDELVVIFDGALAEAYRPEHSRDTAWGRP